MVVQLAITLVTAVVLVGWFTKSADDPREVVAWAATHHLHLTDRNRAMVTYYVRLAITLRVIGGVAGGVLGHLFDDATEIDTTTGLTFWIWVILGWLLGAGWAEYRLTRPASNTPSASLTPRSVADYLGRGLRAAPVAAAAGAAGLALVGLLITDPVGPSSTPPGEGSAGPITSWSSNWHYGPASTVGLVVGGIGVLLIAALVITAIRAVVGRRQPATEPSLVAADDAIRASAVHHLAGGGTAAILLIATQMAHSITRPYELPYGLRGWLPLGLGLGAVVTWRFAAYRAWRVRRTDVQIETA